MAVSGIVFACVSGGALLGMLLRSRLPDHHLGAESKDVVRLAMGLVATMTALVLGMLVASAKASFDAQRHGVAQLAANTIVLDRFLAYYGEEARPTRELLCASVVDVFRRTWPEDDPTMGRPTAGGRAEGRYDELYVRILALQPRTDVQRAIQAQALKLVGETGQMRWLLFAQERGTTLPTPFLVVLAVWLTFLLASFGLFAPGNATALLSLAVCALSVSSAVFLVLDLDHPFDGIIRTSGEPLRVALEQIGR
ncbi:bestrophin-like domain [Tautonia plasticadhaerens]|nr:DUF4239 domain-containing protein [Tautonia plasticadhaerens]